MKILCLNTAFPTAQIACEFNGKNVFEEIDAKAKSSENVLPAIEKILSSNDLLPVNLSHVAVVTGPGSFTGLRIGVAIVKGIACVHTNLKIISINSLDLMAFQHIKTNKAESDFYCILNALSGRYFLAKYNENNKRTGDCLLTEKLPEDISLVGLETENLSVATSFIKVEPKTILEFSKKLISEGKFTSLENLEPFYLRLSQAEENLIKKK